MWRTAARASSVRQADTRATRALTVPQGGGSSILAVVANLLGHPYRYGADRGSFDCSGLVLRVFAKIGVTLPHSARAQFALGDRVQRDDLEPGDLVFFHINSRHRATHVGIYIGGDNFVHASRHGGQVQINSLDQPYFSRHYLGARRLEI